MKLNIKELATAQTVTDPRTDPVFQQQLGAYWDQQFALLMKAILEEYPDVVKIDVDCEWEFNDQNGNDPHYRFLGTLRQKNPATQRETVQIEAWSLDYDFNEIMTERFGPGATGTLFINGDEITSKDMG